MTGLRRVRSFVRRARQPSPAALASWARLWSLYGLASEDLAGIPRAGREVVLDIGFGDGEALLALAALHPERDYVGIEVYRAGLLKALRGIEERALTNVYLVEADALEVLPLLRTSSVSGVQVFFPDPWPKTRHHKRRLVGRAFLAEITRLLRPGGWLHIATDWAAYADEVAALAEATPGLQRAPRTPWRPATKFERRGLLLGQPARDLVYARAP